MESQSKATAPMDIRQVEFKAGLGKALRHSGQSEFALLLAMLQQDVTQRLSLQEEEQNARPLGIIPVEEFNFYPEVPLKTEPQHFSRQEQLGVAVHSNDLATAKLLAHMHPSPLSLYNDVKRVPDDVVANCDLFTQMKINKIPNEDIPVDPTLLYESVKEVRELGLD